VMRLSQVHEFERLNARFRRSRIAA